ncbi:MAG TPA: RIP metalloprotease RseP [Bacteroidota bacterium]|nr:RIP metalloprotease RseP [Bacteroidota bacterium]
MEFLTTIFYFLITIGVLVFIHEFGHFLAAKACRMRVDRFSIGFPPRAFGKTFGETDYCVSWIPVGGYVKIAGMIDESFDTDFVNHEPQPWEFRSKPIWQRMIVISAGVIMNIFLAIAIFWGINFVNGGNFRQTTEVGYVIPNSAAEKAGFKEGDKILAVNGEKITHWDAIQSAMYVDFAGEDLTVDVERAGKAATIDVPHSLVPDISDAAFGFLPSSTEAVVGDVLRNKPAESAGVKPEDVIISIDHQQVINQFQVTRIIKANAGKKIEFEFRRNGGIVRTAITPTTEGMIGISIESRYVGPVLHERYSIIQALPRGLNDVYGATKLFVNSLWHIVVGKASFSKSVAGPVKIAQMATRTAEVGVMSFLGFMALLSISLAVMNILPFPALDGGHLAMLVYEAIFGKPIPHKVQQTVQQAGVLLLLTFMVFVIYNDIAGF